MKRVILLVADGVGCGEAADAAAYGDSGAHTLGNLARAVDGLALPNLQALGLGNVAQVQGVAPSREPGGAYGRMQEASVGKDTITGHWEMAGLLTDKALPTYPHGFPPEILAPFERAAGRGVLGNKPASGTEIIEELGLEHLTTGKLIVYTSADSVFQIAAHTDVVPIGTLYRICEAAREICNSVGLGRVIARPFVGEPGSFKRTYARKDWPLLPLAPTLLENVSGAGKAVVSIGKISDIFGGKGVTTAIHTEGNNDGFEKTLQALDAYPEGLIFVNLVDFDMLYGHRNNCEGFKQALERFDAWIPLLRDKLLETDLVLITADHGNDPTFSGTDHTREDVPLLAFGPQVLPVDLGVRSSFSDVGQTTAQALGVESLAHGKSFLADIMSDAALDPSPPQTGS